MIGRFMFQVFAHPPKFVSKCPNCHYAETGIVKLVQNADCSGKDSKPKCPKCESDMRLEICMCTKNELY